MNIAGQDLWKLILGRLPGQLVIQWTDRCNARCPQCGMRVTNRFQRHTLSPEEIRRIIDAAARQGVRLVSFTGGEPLLELDELIGHLDYAGRAGLKYIRTGTNGFLFAGSEGPGFMDKMKRLAERLAATPLRNFWISIDSADPAVHEKMRGLPGVIQGIEKALPVFHEQGLYPSANLGLNRNTGSRHKIPSRPAAGRDPVYLDDFEDAFYLALQEFYDRVMALGFDMVNTCYPMSIDETSILGEGLSAVYAATSIEDVVSFTQAEKSRLFRALLRAVPEYRSRLRIFTPLVSLNALARDYEDAGPSPAVSYPCRGGLDFFFVDARLGHTYPCGYRGNEDFGKLYQLNGRRTRIKSECRRCDWECFRDPSELLGPILQGLTDPYHLMKRIRGDRRHYSLWLEDLRYYRACDLFDGRRPIDYSKLNKFRPK